ncbi:ATP-binding cassette domain-containing protein [Ancylothrix sp. C2]|uniref:ABC transporter ATP-binding protein n=1 Tax=Ancylothrix sp. D3o TaxID=2953691 RepID=UPI0021BB155E|nr:ATP-binding cassette domain-containing protein [Ancylothrix sp. D3o]MCT7949954.1 ATP-binding cassette domain-containing protein [Ancylothrix sp. D3o]
MKKTILNSSTIETYQVRLDQVSLTTSLGSQYLVKDISFEINAGEKVAIVGPSGAGKTSLLRLLNRLSEPTSGSIYIENQDYRLLPAIQLRRDIMLVQQESKLLGMPVKDSLVYGLKLQNLNPQIIRDRLITWIEKMRLPNDWMERTEVQLSAGQRQWVAITRALITQPKILLLDEPTSALDAGRGTQLISVLKELASTTKTTILMVNHQLDMVEEFATRVLHIQEGKLIADMPASQINWQHLRQSLIEAEQKAAEEWD